MASAPHSRARLRVSAAASASSPLSVHRSVSITCVTIVDQHVESAILLAQSQRRSRWSDGRRARDWSHAYGKLGSEH